MSSVDSDADLARRLEQEWNPPGDNSAIVQRHAISQQSAQNDSPRFVGICIAFVVVELVISIVCLVMSRNSVCDRPLKQWVISRVVYDVLVMPNYLRRQTGVSVTPMEEKQFHWLKQFEFVSFVLGQVMVFDSQTCHATSPFLYGWSVSMIGMFYIGMLSPQLLLLGICFCLPCVLLVFHVLTPSPGASSEVIDSIPLVTYSKETYGKEDPEHLESGRRPDPTCSICMEDYQESDSLRALPCEHDFHAECLDRWLRVNATCPLCRSSLKNSDLDTVPLTSRIE